MGLTISCGFVDLRFSARSVGSIDGSKQLPSYDKTITILPSRASNMLGHARSYTQLESSPEGYRIHGKGTGIFANVVKTGHCGWVDFPSQSVTFESPRSETLPPVSNPDGHQHDEVLCVGSLPAVVNGLNMLRRGSKVGFVVPPHGGGRTERSGSQFHWVPTEYQAGASISTISASCLRLVTGSGYAEDPLTRSYIDVAWPDIKTAGLLTMAAIESLRYVLQPQMKLEENRHLVRQIASSMEFYKALNTEFSYLGLPPILYETGRVVFSIDNYALSKARALWDLLEIPTEDATLEVKSRALIDPRTPAF